MSPGLLKWGVKMGGQKPFLGARGHENTQCDSPGQEPLHNSDVVGSLSGASRGGARLLNRKWVPERGQRAVKVATHRHTDTHTDTLGGPVGSQQGVGSAEEGCQGGGGKCTTVVVPPKRTTDAV